MRASQQIVLVCAAAAASAPGVAAEWSAAPTLSWSVDHHSNRRLVVEGEAGQSGAARLDVLLKRSMPTSTVAIRPRFELQRFTDQSADDTDNHGLELLGQWRGERWILNGSAATSRESTLTSQLTEDGLIDGDRRRRTNSASVSWARTHSERFSSELRASHSDVAYSGPRSSSLYDYRYPTLSMSARLAWTARTSLELTAYAGELSSGLAFDDSRNIGMQAGAQHALSDRTTLRAALGVTQRSAEFVDDDGHVGQLEIAHLAAVSSWRAYATRSVTASGRGVLVERDEMGVSYSYRFSPRLSSGVSIRNIRNNDDAAIGSGERRSFAVAEAALNWQITPTWVVGARAGASRAEEFFLADASTGWRGALNLTWAPRPHTISR